MTLRDAYTTKELTETLKITRQAIDQRAKREGWQSRARKGRGGGHEWLVSSMPEATRASIGAALAAEAQNLPAPRAGHVPASTVVPDYAWEKAKARYRVVMAWREYVAKAKKKGVKSAEATAQFLAMLNAGLLLPSEVLARTGAASPQTLYRWFKAYKDSAGDVESLSDKRGGWMRGAPRGCGQIGEEAERAFLAIYLRRNQHSVMFSYGCMAGYLENKGLPVPSYTSVRRFVARFDAAHHDVVVWMREGEKAYSDKVGMYLSRDDTRLRVGDVLVADGHKMNFEVINPETGKPCRMTLIGWQDWASRMFVGFDIMLAESTQAISSSFFNAIVNLGREPGSVYIDNGKAFKNKYFDGDVDLEDFNGLYARLGIAVSHSLPYVARTKIIERWWRDFDQQCAVALPSYIGRDVAHKPSHMKMGERWARAQQAREELIPTVEEVKRMVIEFAKWKAMQPHPTRPGTTPWEVFMAGRGAGFSDAELERLSRQFLFRRQVHPKRCRFTMLGVEFVSDALHGLNMPLTAHYSYTDLSQVYLYDGDRLVCTARPVATIHPMAKLYGTELDVKAVTEAQKEQARLRNTTRRLASDLAARGLRAEVLETLPYMLKRSERRTPLVAHEGGKALEPAAPIGASIGTPMLPQGEPELTAAELEELRELEAQIRAQADLEPAYQVPDFFASERDKYEFFFDLEVIQGTGLTAEHAAFMREYEQSPAYASSAKRYEDMRELFGTPKSKAAI